MLRRRAVSLVLSGRAAWLRRQPMTVAAATLILRHPEARLGAVDARGISRMARRIPPVRPDGYSTSDGEADACRDDEEDLEPAAGAEGEDEEEVDWDGFTLDLAKGTIEDAFPDDEEEEEGEK